MKLTRFDNRALAAAAAAGIARPAAIARTDLPDLKALALSVEVLEARVTILEAELGLDRARRGMGERHV